MNNSLLKALIATLCTLTTTSAMADPYTLGSYGGDPQFLTDSGIVVLSSGTTPLTFEQDKGISPVGTFTYSPAEANSSGAIVGMNINSVEGEDNRYSNFFFVTHKGQESISLFPSALFTTTENGNIGINEAGQIVVATQPKLVFFNNTTLVSEVLPGPNQSLILTGSYVSVFPNGDALIKVSEFGTPRWNRVTNTGVFTKIAPEILNPDLEPIVDSIGQVIIRNDGKIYTSDLTSPPVAMEVPIAIKGRSLSVVDVNTKGQFIVEDKKVHLVNNLGPDNTYYLVEQGKPEIALTCLFPNNKKYAVQRAWGIANSGQIGVDLYSKSGQTNGLLTPTGDTHIPNYCTQVSMSVIGSCKKYFTGLSQQKDVPSNMKCQLQVVVKDAKGKAVSGAKVITASDNGDKIARGKTNSSGKLSVCIREQKKVAEDRWIVFAPYNHPSLQ